MNRSWSWPRLRIPLAMLVVVALLVAAGFRFGDPAAVCAGAVRVAVYAVGNSHDSGEPQGWCRRKLRSHSSPTLGPTRSR